MKKALIIMFIVLLICSTFNYLADSVRIKEGSNPNVRTKPSTDGQILGNAKSGEVYELLATSGNWYKIRLKNGTEGWIANGMATIIQPQPTVQNNAKSQTRVNIGTIIRFGEYEQDNNLSNGKETIEWRVLSIKNNQALVVSSIGLDAVSYGKAMDVNEYSESGLSWENSDLRKWLNNTFINTAFSKEEQSKIISVQVLTTDKAGTHKTNDKVFILSIAEAEKYFRSTEDMACAVSKYAKSKLNKDSGAITETGLGSWWLRNMTSTYKQADRSNFMESTYNEAGFVAGDSGVKNAKAGNGCPIFCDYLITVRPSMWIILDDYSDNIGTTTAAPPKATIKPTVRPTAKPTPKPTAKPTATPKPNSGYMSDRELIEMAKGYFYLHGGSENGITGATIEHQGNTSYVYIAYNFHCYVVKVNRRTGLGLGMTKLF